MDTLTIVIIIAISILLVLVASFFAYRAYRNFKATAIGRQGERKVKNALNKFAKKNEYKTLHDVYFPLYDKTTQVDHILMGKFGLLVVETKSHNGEIYGTETETNWTQLIGRKKNKFYNPLKQNKAHVDCIRHILNKKGFYNIQIDSLVVFPSKKVILNIPKSLPIITISLLKSYLKKPRYSKDNNINIDDVYHCLQNTRLTNNDIIKTHTANVKQMSKGR